MLSMHLLLGEYFIFKISLDELVVHFVTESTFLDPVSSFFYSSPILPGCNGVTAPFIWYS